MPTDTKTQVDEQAKLQEYKQELENAISIIDSAVDNGGATTMGLDMAINEIKKTLDKDKYGELYKKLQIGYICQTREATRELLKEPFLEELEKKVKKDRDKIKRILRAVERKIREAEEVNPFDLEVTEKPDNFEAEFNRFNAMDQLSDEYYEITDIYAYAGGKPLKTNKAKQKYKGWTQQHFQELIKALNKRGESSAEPSPPAPDTSAEKDPLYNDAVAYVVTPGNTISISSAQRKLNIGYNRAAKLFEEMARDGIVERVSGKYELVTPAQAPSPAVPTPPPAPQLSGEKISLHEAREAVKDLDETDKLLGIFEMLRTNPKTVPEERRGKFYGARDRYLGLRDVKDIGQKVNTVKKIRTGLWDNGPDAVKTILNRREALDDQTALKIIFESGEMPATAEKAKQKIKDILSQVQAIMDTAKKEAETEQATAPQAGVKKQPTAVVDIDDVKKRAIEFIDHGDLQSAIDTVVADLSKDESRPEAQRRMIGMMGMTLKNDPDLKAEDVREWINGFPSPAKSSPTGAPSRPQVSPNAPKPGPGSKGPDLFNESLKTNPELRDAVRILESIEKLRELSGTEIRMNAGLSDFDVSEKVQNWLKRNADIAQLVAEKPSTATEMDSLQKALLDKIKTLKDAGIYKNLKDYFESTMDEVSKQKAEEERKRKEEERKRKQEEEAKKAEEARIQAEKERMDKEIGSALNSYPVLAKTILELSNEDPEYSKLILTAWRIYEDKTGAKLSDKDRTEIKDVIANAIEIAKVDTPVKRATITDDLKYLLKTHGATLRATPYENEPEPPKPEPPAPTPAPPGGGGPGAAPEPPTPAPAPEGGGGAPSETTAKETREKLPKDFQKEVDKLMAEVLADKTLYHKKDPASIAIDTLLRTKHIRMKGLSELKGFLLKPKLTLTKEVDDLTKESITKLRSMLKKKEQEEKQKNREIDSIDKRLGSRDVSKSEADELRKDVAKLQKELNEIENEKDRINVAIGYKNGTTRYRSTTQLLAMINYYISSEKMGERPSQAEIIQRVDEQIESGRKKVYREAGKVINFLFGVASLGTMLKPSLPATLKSIAKDEHLSKVGEEKLAKLAKTWDNRGAVNAWINSLEGSEEEKITKVVPRIIAYLEMALRSGNMRYIRKISAYRAERLVKNLKAARHDYITNKIDREMSGDQHTDIDRMNAYFRELNNATVTQNEITKKFIRRKAVVRSLLGAGIVGVGAAGGIVGAVAAKIGLMGGSVAAGAGAASFETKNEKVKNALRSGAKRAVIATALGTGAAVLTGGVLLPVLAAGGGLFSPELREHKEQVKKVGGATYGLAKFGLLFGLTGGLYGAWKAKKWVGKKMAERSMPSLRPSSMPEPEPMPEPETEPEPESKPKPRPKLKSVPKPEPKPETKSQDEEGEESLPLAA